MKKFLFLLLVLPLYMWGQKTIQQGTEDYEGRAFFDDDLYVHGKATYQFYYDENDNKIKHGSYVVKGDDWWGMNKEIKLKTNGMANYVEGVLNGTLTMSQTCTTPRYSGSWSFKATYSNGFPNGVWTYTQTGIPNTLSASMTWKNGKVSAFKSEKGVSLTLDDDGYIKSGTLEGVSIQNGIVKNKFVRKNGEHSAVEQEQKSLIESYITGNILEKDLLEKGYVLAIFETKIDDWFTDHLTKSFANIKWFDANFQYPPHPAYKMLRMVSIVSFDEIVAYYDNKYLPEEKQWHYSRIDIEKVLKEHNLDNKYMTDETCQRFKTYHENKMNEIKEEAKKAEEERLAAQAKKIEEAKKAVVKESMDKLVALSASKFDVKLFGGDIQIHVDYDNNPNFWRSHFVSSGDLRTQLGAKLKPFFAIDSYVINEIKDNMADITIEKYIKKGKSEFWRTTIKFAENGLIDLDSSFDFSTAKQVVKE